ncbi:hypothetical protein CPB83DRAFT_886171 [Crepidotus variabilis]|uniref:F-box domain-containing protein n=1 Tax=Crepidotus variabilis TaxID=179855 RepID=A0A9P6E8U4_9AGAR|nr:hypothetical protein CPB83DRAFT_886171 [Crepidotus variabilis]
MDSETIPDDVWITVFETVEDPAVLAVLVRVCRRFHNLASKPLLRELRWLKPESTARNIVAWDGAYKKLRPLTRKLVIGIPYDFSAGVRYHMCEDMQLHDQIHHQITLFPSLSEIVFDGTIISPYTYSKLAAIPTLQSLSLRNCTLADIHTTFQERTEANQITRQLYYSREFPAPPPLIPPPFNLLSIKHFSLSRASVAHELDLGIYHPLCLLTAPNLTSISISWTAAIAARYGHSRWILPNIRDVDIDMPLLTRDLLDALAAFIDRCPRGPRVRLRIEKHNLSEAQMGSVLVPLRGVWSYEGPLGIAACAAVKSLEPTLTHIKMNEPLDLTPLLDGLEKLPRSVEDLELHVRYWDMEVLFAAKHLFKSMRKLTIKYIRGTLSKDFLVVLGADILAHLPKLTTLKILNITAREDPAAARLLKSLHVGGTTPVVGGPWLHGYHGHLHPSVHGHPHNGHTGNGGSSLFGSTGNGSLVQHHSQLYHPPPTHHPSAPLHYLPTPALDYDMTYEEEEEMYDQQIIEATLQDSLNDVDPWDAPSSSNQPGLMRNHSRTTNSFSGPSTSSLPSTTSISTVSPPVPPPHSSGPSTPSSFVPLTSNVFISSSDPSSWSHHRTAASLYHTSQGSQLSTSQWRDLARRKFIVKRDTNNFRATTTTAAASASSSSIQSAPVSPSWTSALSQDDSSEILPPNDGPRPSQSAQSELGDYLIGWSRYCRSLRTVQIEEGWYWDRRFEGDRWVLRGRTGTSDSDIAASKGNGSWKGKEKQSFPKGGFLP